MRTQTFYRKGNMIQQSEKELILKAIIQQGFRKSNHLINRINIGKRNGFNQLLNIAFICLFFYDKYLFYQTGRNNVTPVLDTANTDSFAQKNHFFPPAVSPDNRVIIDNTDKCIIHSICILSVCSRISIKASP